MTIKCLFIEDDLDYAEPTSTLLAQRGIETSLSPTLSDAAKKLKNQAFDIVLLDLNLPDGSGLEFLENYASSYLSPIIILSADFKNQSKVSALQLGAYYYLNKPVHIDELEAVIHRVFKSSHQTLNVSSEIQWSIDSNQRLIYHNKAQQPIKLTGNEYELVNILAKNQNKIVTRINLFNLLGKTNPAYNDRSLDVLISRINKKLKTLGGTSPIDSVRGSGYIFRQTISYKN